MPYSNNKDLGSLKINFSASHDQASVQEKIALDQEKLNKVAADLEKIQKSQEKEIINLVNYAKQLVADLQESTKKLDSIHRSSSDEIQKIAKLLLPSHISLTPTEEKRFKKIENTALSNTCIIKSAGDETIKFQLGILGYTKDNNLISESEFKYLTIVRLQQNNLLDSFRLRVKDNMILEQTPLEICQAINKALSGDPDYQDSKEFFVRRLNGIDFELNLQRLENIDRECRDFTLLQKECMSLSFQNSDDSFEEELSYPELPTHPIELNAQQPSATLREKIEYPKENKNISEFVSLIQELIPEKKKNVINIDSVKAMSLETIMQASLERSSPLSEMETFKLNYVSISKIQEASTLALHKMQEKLKNSYLTDGFSIYEEMERSCDTSKKNRAENLKKPEPCKLTGEKLVHEYFKLGKRYLEGKIKKIENQRDLLEYNKKNKFAEFDKNTAQYDNLPRIEIEAKREKIYLGKKQELDLQFEKAMKQQALWDGHETFTPQKDKKNKIAQEKIAFSKKELDSRKLVLKYNPNVFENKTINVYQDGVYLVSNKKTEDGQSSIQISNTRASFKKYIQGQTSSSFYSGQNQKEKNCKLTEGTRLLRS